MPKCDVRVNGNKITCVAKMVKLPSDWDDKRGCYDAMRDSIGGEVERLLSSEDYDLQDSATDEFKCTIECKDEKSARALATRVASIVDDAVQDEDGECDEGGMHYETFGGYEGEDEDD